MENSDNNDTPPSSDFSLIEEAIKKGYNDPYSSAVMFLRDMTTFITNQIHGNFVMYADDDQLRLKFALKGRTSLVFQAKLSATGFPITIMDLGAQDTQCKTKEDVVRKVTEILGQPRFIQMRAHADADPTARRG